mmetsp:Transcript_55455/g.166297  ORF Transcript_55455/g.166297 Transcript_55455/m.166297 type:complete len:218 (+) Transcript_55455:566-1219(+)
MGVHVGNSIAKIVHHYNRRGEEPDRQGRQEGRVQRPPPGEQLENSVSIPRHSEAMVRNSEGGNQTEVQKGEQIAQADVRQRNISEPDVPQGIRTARVRHGVEAAAERHEREGRVERRAGRLAGRQGHARPEDERRREAQRRSTRRLSGSQPPPLRRPGLAESTVIVGPLDEIGVIVVQVGGELDEAREGGERDGRRAGEGEGGVGSAGITDGGGAGD